MGNRRILKGRWSVQSPRAEYSKTHVNSLVPDADTVKQIEAMNLLAEESARAERIKAQLFWRISMAMVVERHRLIEMSICVKSK